MSQETADLLRRGRGKIPTQEQWTRHVHARTAEGYMIDPEAQNAVCWCGYGAILAVDGFSKDMQLAGAALDNACGEIFSTWQDRPETTHADVLACFDRAITAEESTP